MSEWDWYRFKGSGVALKYARRDLPTLDRAISLAQGRTACVQAGACLGIYPKRLAQHFKTTYCFEPSLDLFPLLCANAPEPNILKYQAALGNGGPPISTSQTRREGKEHRFPHEGITHVTSEPGTVPAGLSVNDEVSLPLAIERHVLGAMAPNGAEAHLLEQRMQLRHVWRSVFDELEPVGADGIVPKLRHCAFSPGVR
jgi:hypothetical protein